MGQPGRAVGATLGEQLRAIEAELAANRADAALAICQDATTRYPRALSAQRALGETYLALRKTREALGALDRALTGNPEDARACCARALIHQIQGDQRGALAWYRRACDAQPTDQGLRQTYRELATQLGQPSYQPSRVGLARLYLRGGLFTHALREWETLVAEAADHLEAQVGLVETLWRMERPRDAEDWARRVLMNAPSCVKALLIAGIIATETGRDNEAERYLSRAAELDPEHRIAQGLFGDKAALDANLRARFWGDDALYFGHGPHASSGPALAASGVNGLSDSSAQSGSSPMSRSASRPFATSGSAIDIQAAMSRPDLSAAIHTGPLAPPLTPGASLDNQRSVFKETENMLWSAENSDPSVMQALNKWTEANRQTAPVAPSEPVIPAPPPPEPPAPPSQFTGFAGPLALPAWPDDLANNPAPRRPASSQPMPGMATGPLTPDALDGTVPFTPPAISESKHALSDTETRRALRWVQWLQAQGARARNDGVSRGRHTDSLDALLDANTWGDSASGGERGMADPSWPALALTSLPSTGPIPSPTGAPGQPPVPPTRPPARGSGPLGSRITGAPQGPQGMEGPGGGARSGPLSGPLPQPRPEDLRAMFAQIDPPHSGPITSEAPSAGAPLDGARGGSDDETNLASAMSALFGAPAQPSTPAPSRAPEPAPDPAWPEALAGAFEWPEDSASAGRPPTQGSAGGRPDATLEEIERGHSSQGYQQFDLEPGALAALGSVVGGAPAGGSADPAQAVDALLRGPEGVEREPAEPNEREPFADERERDMAPQAPAAPDPKDYPARLAEARRKRDEGDLDGALIEYNAVLRNAPALLPDALADLEALLEERPDHPEAHRLLGDARIRQGDYLSALESLNRSVSLGQDPES